MGSDVDRAGTAARRPGVAEKPRRRVEVAFLQERAFVDRRAAHDELDAALIGRRRLYMVQARLDVGSRKG